MGKKEKPKVTHLKNNKKMETSYNIEMRSIIKIAIIVILILVVVYLFTAVVTGKIKLGSDAETDSEIAIQYEEILAGEVFNQSESDYLVLFYEQGTTIAGLYDTYLNLYKTKANALKYYKVDMANAMNQMYKSEEESNLYIAKASELKVKSDTLIHISNGKVNVVYEGKDAISEYFSNFGK